MLQPGDRIPAFAAVTADGSLFSNGDLAGRSAVIFFYPADNTSGCTREACDFRDARPSFEAANVVVVGVSGDDQASHRDFTDRYRLSFPLLVDVTGDICHVFGVPREGSMAKRVTFLADHNGVIRRVWDAVQVVGHADDVYEAVRDIVESDHARS